MKIAIPIKPLTINKAWRGRRFKTDDYHSFEDLVGYELLVLKLKPVHGWVTIEYEWHIKRFGTTDWDNLIKPIQDILVTHGVIDDDRFIKWGRAEKFKSKEEKIIIKINKYL